MSIEQALENYEQHDLTTHYWQNFSTALINSHLVLSVALQDLQYYVYDNR